MTKANAALVDASNKRSSGTDSQIIDQTIQTKLSNQFRPYYLISGMLFLFSLLEWYRWYGDVPPVPFIMSTLFIVSVVIAYLKQRQFRQELGFLNYGKQGEKTVAEYVKSIFTEYNARVFRDVKINEHLCKYVICAKFGLIVIDVINLPPPDNGEANIEYKDKNLTFNGYRMDGNPVKDLKYSCSILQKALQQSSNRIFPIYGVVVFPNWYVKQYEIAKVNIINPRHLPDVYQNLAKNITNDEQSLASYHLNKYIRANA